MGVEQSGKILKTLNSKKLLREAKKLIPTGGQTFSKGTHSFSENFSPSHALKGKGNKIIDVDNNKYLDFVMGAQPLILGYADDDINKAVKKQLDLGSTFSLANKLEIDVARLLKRHIPSAEQVRFGKNGADATTAAVKIARGYTRRDHIAFCGYHGWHDWFISTTDKNLGIPKFNENLAHPFNYNDIESLKKIFIKYKNKISCVIMEPITVSNPKCMKKNKCISCKKLCKKNFLSEVKKLCRINGALLIFDEVVTGFRYSIGGVQKIYNVIPDLSCFAKAISNGIPLSAVVGKKKYMKLFNDVFFSFTYGGECLGLAAAKACIEKIHKKKVIEKIYKNGLVLKKKLNQSIVKYGLRDIFKCDGHPSRTVFVIGKSKNLHTQLLTKTFIQQELLKSKILWTGYHCITYTFSKKDIGKTIKAYNKLFEKIVRLTKNNISIYKKIHGKPLKPVFTRVADFQAASLKLTSK
jgi:glutamate-1-semialdehyde 2,1-aminomutase